MHVASRRERGAAARFAGDRQQRCFDRHHAAVGHRISRVDHEIDDDLLQLHGISHQRARRRINLRLDHHALADQTAQHAVGVGDDGAQVDRRKAQRLLAREGEQLVRQRRGVFGGSPDLDEIAPERLVGADLPGQHVGVAQDHGQRVVEVVRDAAGQLSDRFQLLRLAQLLFQLLPRLPRRGLGGDATQQRANHFDQDFGTDRLAQITVCTAAQALDLVCVVRIGGRDVQHGNRVGQRTRLQAPADLEAIDVGKMHIEQHERRTMFTRQT